MSRWKSLFFCFSIFASPEKLVGAVTAAEYLALGSVSAVIADISVAHGTFREVHPVALGSADFAVLALLTQVLLMFFFVFPPAHVLLRSGTTAHLL
jgi:hypothetical protein